MTEDSLGARYRRERHLGRGAMGEVWLAEDVLLHRFVAVKSVAPTVREPDPDDLNRMMREARLAARLNHPHAVAVYDLILVDGRPNLVMEYVTGESLAEEIEKAGGRLPAARVTEVGIAVADALAEAHELGIVHRDVKPANILITKRGTPKLADFGIARVTGDVGVTATGLMIGTPAYVAPEVARGDKADARSDVWSLGITLWAALEGHPPFHRGREDTPLMVLHRVLTERVPPPPHGGPIGPAVMRMLDADPSRRPTAAEAVDLLRRPPSSGGSVDPRRQAPVPAPRAAPPTYEQPNRPPEPLPHRADRPVSPPTPTAAYADALRPPPNQPAAGDRGRWIAATVAALVVVAAVVVGAVVLVGRHQDQPVAGGSATPTTTSGSSAGSSSGSAPTGGGSSAPRTTPPVTPIGQTYSGPGGLTVHGPSGWTEDDSSGVDTVHDFDAPGEDRATGTYFRVGIGNPNPETTMRREVTTTETYLRGSTNPYRDVTIVGVNYSTFLGVDSADLEFTGTSKTAGVSRHVIERLWIMDGSTRIIQLNAPSDQYASRRPVFDQLTSTASLS